MLVSNLRPLLMAFSYSILYMFIKEKHKFVYFCYNRNFKQTQLRSFSRMIQCNLQKQFLRNL